MPADDDDSEHDVQSELVKELRHLLRPNLLKLAIPNGGLRHPIVGKRLKEEGLLPGSPDLVFPFEQGKVFWLEMKRAIYRKRQDGGLSDEQLGVHYKLRQLGHEVETAYSVEEALYILYKRGLLR